MSFQLTGFPALGVINIFLSLLSVIGLGRVLDGFDYVVGTFQVR